MASVSAVACSYSALLLHDDEVTALARVHMGSLICNVGAGGPAPAADTAPAGSPAPAPTAAPAEEKKVEAKKEESEEADDDGGFGLLTSLLYNTFSNKTLSS
uniref:60S acidic ribosomal protein P1 n=1 Tax=Sus scrofa TaxID=9823 RepID=F1RN65_PIG